MKGKDKRRRRESARVLVVKIVVGIHATVTLGLQSTYFVKEETKRKRHVRYRGDGASIGCKDERNVGKVLGGLHNVYVRRLLSGSFRWLVSNAWVG